MGKYKVVCITILNYANSFVFVSLCQMPDHFPTYYIATLTSLITYTYRIHGIFGSDFNLANHVNITKLNVCHLGCKHGSLSPLYQNCQLKILPIAFLERIAKYLNHQ